MVHSLGLLIFEFRMACMCGSSVFNLLDESISPIKALMLRTEVLVLCRVTYSSFLYTKVFCKPSAGFVACLSRSSSFIGSSRGFLVYNLQHHGWKVWLFTDPLEILGFDLLTCRLCWIVPRVWTVAWCICVDIEVKPPYSLASSRLKLVPAPHLSASQTSQTQHTSHTHTQSLSHTQSFSEVGAYFPCVSTVKSQIVPEEARAGVYNATWMNMTCEILWYIYIWHLDIFRV